MLVFPLFGQLPVCVLYIGNRVPFGTLSMFCPPPLHYTSVVCLVRVKAELHPPFFFPMRSLLPCSLPPSICSGIKQVVLQTLILISPLTDPALLRETAEILLYTHAHTHLNVLDESLTSTGEISV